MKLLSSDTIWKVFMFLGPALTLLSLVWQGWGFEIISKIVGMLF